jgi:hypothetical protein
LHQSTSLGRDVPVAIIDGQSILKLGIPGNLAIKERKQATQSIFDGSPTCVAFKMLEQATEIPEFVFASGTAVAVFGLRVDIVVKLTVLRSPAVDVI